MCIDATYRFQGAADNSDEELPARQDAGQQEYDPMKPNDFEQMLLRKRRIEKQLTTLINVR
jgi:hypothetical protein